MSFKTPDGQAFETKKEWRKYMYENFYSFSKKVNEPEPLIKMVRHNIYYMRAVCEGLCRNCVFS